ncbi:hypothetical protein [Microvirga terricola]|uniref:DUF2336 domain-containing protein n=1 Tax=Microvirga terricola TaxID=2719797 RepID=A0ABX0VD80_9HYPH|nr:hypothetical protein [Microvirga terricola]NIX77798.1 hypothetical protein [Microvirga terricola]
MMNATLRDFIETVIDKKIISADDVDHLQRHVLSDGLKSRVEAEALLALDRAVEADESWAGALKTLVVDFSVLRLRSAGMGDDVQWLATVLEVGGPSETAMAIAYAVLDQAERVDTALLDFIMRGRQQARQSCLAA